MTTEIIITKEEAVALFGSKAELARALGINKASVTEWPDGKPIPERRALQIYYQLKPEAFA